MAFPFVFHSNFEAGTNAEWDSESDTGSKLDFPHYSQLAAVPGLAAPYEGAYCMRVDLVPGDTNDHVIVEGDIDIATGVTRWFRWAMYVSPNFQATANDNFSIFELQQAAGTQVYTVGFTITATTDAITVWVGEADTPETTGAIEVPKGRWVIFEVQANVDTAAANGDITVYMDGQTVVSLATPVQNAAAVGRGVLGTQVTAATTSGVLLFDDFIMDDAQLFPPRERFPSTKRVLKTGHVFVGPGWIEGANVLSANGTMDLYDSDTGNINDLQSKKLELATGGNFQGFDSYVYFERGCYVVLGGTNPYGEVRLVTQVGASEGIRGPTAHWSDGAIRLYGSKRVPRSLNV